MQFIRNVDPETSFFNEALYLQVGFKNLCEFRTRCYEKVHYSFFCSFDVGCVWV